MAETKPSPRPAADAPEGTVWHAGPVAWFSVSLSIKSNDLDPDEVTRLLGVEPDRSQRKDTPPTHSKRLPEFGLWSVELRREDSAQWDIEVAIIQILDRVVARPEAWKEARAKDEARVFVGLAVDAPNRGFGLSHALLARLADHGIKLDFDLYDSTFADRTS